MIVKPLECVLFSSPFKRIDMRCRAWHNFRSEYQTHGKYINEKIVSVALKTLIFFLGWAIGVAFMPIPELDNAAAWRFWTELMRCCSLQL